MCHLASPTAWEIHALEHLPAAVEVESGIDSHEDGEHHEDKGHAPYKDCMSLILLAPILMGVRRDSCIDTRWSAILAAGCEVLVSK